jgi:hypothetical protein
VVYLCEATSAEGFVQQLAVSYIGHGYWFYVTGVVPDGKDPLAVDRKLIDRYGVDVSKWARARRKRAGHANIHYLRYRRFFVLIATKGEHRFFTEEPKYRDVRRDPIRFDGYSISYKRDPSGKWHPSVRIHPETYQGIKCHLLEAATRRSAGALADELWALPFEAYAPVRTQLLCIYRALNAARAVAGLDPLPRSALRLRRAPVSVFGRGSVSDHGGARS